MNKIFEHANEQHVRALIVYGNSNDGSLYYDSDYKDAVDVNDARNAYQKGILRISDGTKLLSPVCMAGGDFVTFDDANNDTQIRTWKAGEGEFEVPVHPSTGSTVVNPHITKA